MLHLGFDTPIKFTDATVVQISGTVFAGFKPKDEDNVKATDCGLSDVKVCLHRVQDAEASDDAVVACIDTNHNGEYSLSTVIGTLVYPQVDYPGHTFEPMGSDRRKDGDRKYKYRNFGILASFSALSKGELIRHDLFDTTLAPLDVEVAGGGE